MPVTVKCITRLLLALLITISLSNLFRTIGKNENKILNGLFASNLWVPFAELTWCPAHMGFHWVQINVSVQFVQYIDLDLCMKEYGDKLSKSNLMTNNFVVVAYILS